GRPRRYTLKNELARRGIDKPVVTLLTQVLVAEKDPAFQNPTKPVGPFYTREKAEKLIQEKGYVMKEDSGRGWRRVVPSPNPLAILEADVIKDLVNREVLVIASGGGGVPVMKRPDGSWQGLEAVIDKDLAGENLAREVGADILLILTDVEKVALNFRQPNEVRLERVTPEEGRRYQKEGHFKAGSMGPKMEAALRFVESGRDLAVITSLDKAVEALEGKTGTRVGRE
ncbi:MAG: carbamate kinase, partial [Firmicutes bacterium]|nr:carbamate kinase [Bacillota bacterium]